tara:strand:+ start:355 stop:618 length:264 start_codon:yes stop_codon:yes gene_type:complete
MVWKEIGGYLSKFKTLTPPNKAVKDIVMSIIKKEIDINISTENIEVRGDTIFLYVDSFVKTEILLRKNILLRELKNKLGNKIIRDIK